MVNLDIKERNIPTKSNNKSNLINKNIILKENSNNSINNKLKLNLTRIEENLKSENKTFSDNKIGIARADLNENDFGANIQGYEFEDNNFNFDRILDNKYASSMKKMIDDADILVRESQFGNQLFLNENIGIFNQSILNKIKQGNDVNNDEFVSTPSKLQNFDDLYQNETALKTKYKHNLGLTEVKLKNILNNVNHLENIKIDFYQILDKICGKDNRQQVLDAIFENSVEFNDLIEFIKNNTDMLDFQNKVDHMNNMYQEAIEVGRLEDINKSASQKTFRLNSELKDQSSEVKFSTDQKYAENFEFDHHNLDAIAETFNENFTRTNYLNSYDIWTKIGDYSNIKRRHRAKFK